MLDMHHSYSRHKIVSNALKSSYEKQTSNEYWQCSELWDSIFSHRESLKSYSDLMISLNDRFSFTSGIAGVSSDEKKALFAKYYSAFLDKVLLHRFPLSPVGAPSIIAVDETLASLPYLSNLKLFEEVSNFLSQYMVEKKDLHIVEIGAGYGGLAYFMIKSGLARSYTVIDLSQNLEISAFHLSQNFQEMKVNALSAADRLTELGAGTLNFVTPGNIGALEECKFDLVLNSDSLGEMPAGTAQAYIRWIHDHLSEGGCFFSKNGHRRSLDAVQLPSEYGYDRLNLLEIHPPSIISSLFDDFSHYVFLQKSNSPRALASNQLNALCSLYALGLQGELVDLSLAFSQNRLTETQAEFLKTCHLFFSEKSLKRKLDHLVACKADEFRSSIEFMKGITHYVLGDRRTAVGNLSEYLKRTKSYIAEAYAIMVVSTQSSAVLDGDFKFGVKTEFAIDEIRGFQKLPVPLKALAFKVRADVLNKKINYPGNYSPSGLMRLKNIVFNLKEGKGFNTKRL